MFFYEHRRGNTLEDMTISSVLELIGRQLRRWTVWWKFFLGKCAALCVETPYDGGHSCDLGWCVRRSDDDTVCEFFVVRSSLRGPTPQLSVRWSVAIVCLTKLLLFLLLVLG